MSFEDRKKELRSNRRINPFEKSDVDVDVLEGVLFCGSLSEKKETNPNRRKIQLERQSQELEYLRNIMSRKGCEWTSHAIPRIHDHMDRIDKELYSLIMPNDELYKKLQKLGFTNPDYDKKKKAKAEKRKEYTIKEKIMSKITGKPLNIIKFKV